MENNISIPQNNLIKDSVFSFWQVQRLRDPALKETIIPKGVVEIIFNFETNPIHGQVNNQPITVPRCFLQVYSTAPVKLQLAGSQTFFGVVLNPAAVKHIFHFPPHLFVNCVIDLTINDKSLYTLWQQLGEQKNFNNRVTVFTHWLMKRLPQFTDRENAFNRFLTSYNSTPISVTQLAEQFCYSSRQLSRKFFELTGMNTEQVLLYKKYLQAVHLIHSSGLSLTEIAYCSNFYDQSHFIKTFRAFSHIAPNEYRQQKSPIVGHIFENVR